MCLKTLIPVIARVRFWSTCLAFIIMGAAAGRLAAEPPADPAHAAHVAAGAMPADAAKSDPALSQQLSDLKAKVAQLESALARIAPRPSVAATPAASAMPGMAAPTAPMAGMNNAAPSAMPATGGMSGNAPPPGGAMNMMGMMEKMMGMMDKMMSMGGGATPAGAPMAGGGGMGMGMMKSEMGGMGGGAMPAGAPAAGMSGGMGMDKMEMMGQMSGGAGMAMPSALPGFPGASHIYHIGSTDFFLDHPQHIALSTEQQRSLNQIKEKTAMDQATLDRKIEEGEQELWKLTASDTPDAAKIEIKVREIEKARGDKRLGFVRAVGEAAKVLTDQQRSALLGNMLPTQPPTVQPAMPVAPGGMGDM